MNKDISVDHAMIQFIVCRFLVLYEYHSNKWKNS